MTTYSIWGMSILAWLAGVVSCFAQNGPKVYEAHYAPDGIVVDGQMDEVWEHVPWTDLFMDIRGPEYPDPPLDTRMKMMWDDDGLYILVWMEETHLWAELEDRDAIIFWENDFEVFLKPDSTTGHYFEYEINARNTLFDLLMTRPYNKGGKAIITWDSKTVQHAVRLEGSLNNPDDQDRGWWVEMKIPYRDVAHYDADIRPAEGKSWQINCSRVQWQIAASNGKYVKKKDEHGRDLPEDNWVWTPQYVVNMHIPEHWGTVRFVR